MLCWMYCVLCCCNVCSVPCTMCGVVIVVSGVGQSVRHVCYRRMFSVPPPQVGGPSQGVATTTPLSVHASFDGPPLLDAEVRYITTCPHSGPSPPHSPHVVTNVCMCICCASQCIDRSQLWTPVGQFGTCPSVLIREVSLFQR